MYLFSVYLLFILGLSVTLISFDILFPFPCGTITARLAELTKFNITSEKNYINLIIKCDFLPSISLKQTVLHINMEVNVMKHLCRFLLISQT